MRIIYFDTETTGLNPLEDKIIELALFVVDEGKVSGKYDWFIKIDEPLSKEIVDLTGITDDVLNSEGVSDRVVARKLMRVMCEVEDVLMVAHNCQFDLNFIYSLLMKFFPNMVDNLFEKVSWLDTLTVFRDRKPYPHKLSDLVDYYDLGEFRFHRAIDDTKVLPPALIAMNRERSDVMKYYNVFGFNPKYGVNGKKFSFIRYVPQRYHDSMVKSEDILPMLK